MRYRGIYRHTPHGAEYAEARKKKAWRKLVRICKAAGVGQDKDRPFILPDTRKPVMKKVIDKYGKERYRRIR